MAGAFRSADQQPRTLMDGDGCLGLLQGRKGKGGGLSSGASDLSLRRGDEGEGVPQLLAKPYTETRRHRCSARAIP